MPFDMLRLALDESMRRYDQDGRLHVQVSHLTKATVNPYNGSEIPGYDALGLDPDRVYALLRDPAELEKATPSFNNLPLLDQHIPVTASDAAPDHVVGSTGSHATWNAPFIDNSLVFWTDAAIAAIETGAMKELSSAYRYKPDMTPGSYEGRRYDGVMRDIQANHVALVEAGRAGSDVVVMDSKPKEINMPMTALGAYLAGSATTYVKPFLAQDSKFKFKDIPPLFKGVTAKNWASKRLAIEAALMRQVKPHLAEDAEIHIHEHMDGAGAEAPSDEGEVIDPLDDTPGAGVAETPVTAKDDDLMQTVQQLLTGKIDDEDLAMIMHALQNLKPPAANPPDDNGNGNGNGDPAPPAEEATDNAEAIENPGLKSKPPMAGDRKPAMDAIKLAVDAAVKKAVAATRENERRIREAEKIVRPYVGDVRVAMDSAEELYKFALEQMGEDVTDLHPSAYRAVLTRIPVPGSERAASTRLAMDATGNKKYLERFPNANRLMRH
jgi:hypothetical protein